MEGLTRHDLDGTHTFYEGRLPPSLAVDFDALWALHPTDYHTIKMHGRDVKTPRWQQAYGNDYAYTGRVNHALPMPPSLQPHVTWCRRFHPGLNGLLINWYDAAHKHYIGRHRDSIKRMVKDSPIVTMSFGATRIFRLRPWRDKNGKRDFEAQDGTVFLMPFATNRAWTHEVPHHERLGGRRISVTLRAFE